MKFILMFVYKSENNKFDQFPDYLLCQFIHRKHFSGYLLKSEGHYTEY